MTREEAVAAGLASFERVLAETDRKLGIVHVDGVPWHEAPRPRWLHRCRAQTTGMGVARCACGAISGPAGYWMERNSRRKGARR